MNQLSIEDAAYIAGLLDGEGCFAINLCKYKRKNGRVRVYFQPHIKISMTDERAIKFVSQIFNAEILKYIRKNKSNIHFYKPIFQTQLKKRKELRLFLTQILPYAKTKAEQCRLLLELLELQKEKRTHIKEQAEIYRKLRTLNSEISDERFQKVLTMLYRKARHILTH